MITDLVAFSLAAALIVLIPGPDTLVVLRNVVVGGRRQAALTSLGVLTGLMVWMSAAALGLTAVLRASQDGYLILRLVGATYLLWIGIQALRSRVVGQPVETAVRSHSVVGRGFRAGFMTDLLNPKVGVFFITFFPAFIPRHAPVAAVTVGLGLIFVAETALYFALMLVFVHRLTSWLSTDKFRRRLNRATGLVLIGFGIRLAAEG
ncbi:MAG TPA: LysE family translocator [Acidimicrobiales bacterium]|nr:LysE family translocator [Acidimicrobiales bacterium]